MPLPSGGTWPPEEYVPDLDTIRTHRAWWTGDSTALTEAYTRPFARMRPSQYRGGIVGAVARAFWGKPTPDGEQLAKCHVPIAADIANMSADLLFAHPPQVVVTAAAEDDKRDVGQDDIGDDVTQVDPETEAAKAAADKTKNRIDEYIEDGLWSRMREGAESAAALSGTYVRVVWDKTVHDRPWLACVDADFALPEFFMDRLRAVTFWHEIEKTGQVVWRLLERHEPGTISYGLYEGTPENLGRRHPLTEKTQTAGLAENLDDGDTVQTGYEGMTAQYVPNMRPNKRSEMQIGRSDFADIEGGMDELDEAMTSWMRDLRLGKTRIIVPEIMTESLGAGLGVRWNDDQEVFVPVTGGDPNQMRMEMFQPSIRFAEHEATCQHLIEQVVRGAGYSMATLAPGDDDGPAPTATQIRQKKERSLTTRERKIGYWRPALAGALEALLAIDKEHFGADVTVLKPAIEWPDAVSPDPLEVAQTIQSLDAARALSDKAKVEFLHPDWDEDQVDEAVTEMSGSSFEQAANAVNTVATMAQGLGKAIATGGMTEEMAAALTQFVTDQIKGPDGEPIDVGDPDFSGATEQAELQARAADAAIDASRAKAAGQGSPASGGGRPGGGAARNGNRGGAGGGRGGSSR